MKVSIIIPHVPGKRELFLIEAVASVESQTYKDIELIVESSEKSANENHTNGFLRSSGDIIHFLHDDDILTPDAVDVAVKAIEGFDFIHGNAYNFNHVRTVNYIPAIKNPTLQDMLKHNHLHFATIYYTRQAFHDSLPFDGDWPASMRLLYLNKRLGYVNHFMAYYRQHSGQMCQSKYWHNDRKPYEIQRMNELYG